MTLREGGPAQVGRAQLDPALVAAVCAAYATSPVERVERVAGSIANQDFMVTTATGGFLLKAGPAGDLVSEAWACDRVRRAGVSAPEIVAVEAEPATLPLPFLVMRRLPGGPVDTSPAVLVEAGRQLRLVHEIALPGYGALRIDDGAAQGRERSWAAVVQSATADLDALVGDDVLSEAAAAAAADIVRHAPEVHFTGRSVLLHGDLKQQHIFAEQDRFVALIDWGDARAGDPRFDLARLAMAGDGVLTPFLRGYDLALTDDLRRVLTGYRLVWNLRSLRDEHAYGGDWFDVYRHEIQSAVDFLTG